MKKWALAVALLLCGVYAMAADKNYKLQSPSGTVSVEISAGHPNLEGYKIMEQTLLSVFEKL